MNLAEATARELRQIEPRENEMAAAIEYIYSLGWRFRSDPADPKPYNTGWWVNTEHPTKNRPAGDPRSFGYSAWTTLITYVAPERLS